MNINENKNLGFNLEHTLHKLKHYLPSQGPLKDFVHHNTLHAFQDLPFEEAIQQASAMFGIKTSLSIDEYRELYKKHIIREDILEQRIMLRKGEKEADKWIYKVLNQEYDQTITTRLNTLHNFWKIKYDLDIDASVHSKLFKLIGTYLDQGIGVIKSPIHEDGFLATIKNLDKESFTKIIHSKRCQELLHNPTTKIEDLLHLLVGDENHYEQYLFDQQFAHPGWAGLVCYIEDDPKSLLDERKITLHDFIFIDLLLEIDALDIKQGKNWKPISNSMNIELNRLFEKVKLEEKHEVISIWQEAFEWSYYDQVLAGILKMKGRSSNKPGKTFQAIFCIDDREGSIRRHIEQQDNKCETFGTPGFFGVEFYYRPQGGKFATKVCPAPVTPKYLIKDTGAGLKTPTEVHFSTKTNHPFYAFFASIILGFISAYQLFVNIFKPELSAGASSSFSHMEKNSKLTILHTGETDKATGLQVGFTIDEMVERVEAVLKGIGLVEDFGPLVYIIGHGASSINNTHYAGYDCGACCGRPGSVNARVFSYMANHPEVRMKLEEIGIFIPSKTQFIGALHDTTRDEIAYYDEDILSVENKEKHKHNQKLFLNALAMNSKERSRRFFSIDSKQEPDKIHQEIKNRSVSLFEPRPELNHATNALCIVGRRGLNEGLFLDRRAFFNSYDYQYDPGGKFLFKILSAATPVCGGINLEYYFSRVDNQKSGAGSKLPHNVMGLIGVANGVEGDLRPGLPYQMIDLHDPLRLLMIIEHYPQVVLKVIQKNPKVYEWYLNEWVNLVIIHPDTSEMMVFKQGEFKPYIPIKKLLDTVTDVNKLFESGEENYPVYLIKK